MHEWQIYVGIERVIPFLHGYTAEPLIKFRAAEVADKIVQTCAFAAN